MAQQKAYTTQLQAGLGLIDESRILLDLWSPGMTTTQLFNSALLSGRFPQVTARRLRNIVVEAFTPRYLVSGGAPAALLKRLSPTLSNEELVQLMFVFTARANPVLGDFVRAVYWPRYVGGHAQIDNSDARAFVQRAIDDGQTSLRWSESTVRRVSAYLTGCCADFGLLEAGRRTRRRLQPPRILPLVGVCLMHELHFRGVGDNALPEQPDFSLFGLSRDDVVAQLKRLSALGWLILQSAGGAVQIGWKFQDMEALCHVVAER